MILMKGAIARCAEVRREVARCDAVGCEWLGMAQVHTLYAVWLLGPATRLVHSIFTLSPRRVSSTAFVVHSSSPSPPRVAASLPLRPAFAAGSPCRAHATRGRTGEVEGTTPPPWRGGVEATKGRALGVEARQVGVAAWVSALS